MALPKNEGGLDRIVRFVAGVGLLGFTFFGSALAPSSVPGIIAIIVGAVLAITSIVGFCPAYALLGLKTNGK